MVENIAVDWRCGERPETGASDAQQFGGWKGDAMRSQFFERGVGDERGQLFPRRDAVGCGTTEFGGIKALRS